MGRDRALVRNAADPAQVKRAERKERDRVERFRTNLTAVMATEAGRQVLWELLTRAGIYQSIWDPSSKIHYNAGRQDFGHEMLAALLDADEDLYQLMEREMRAWQRVEDRGTDAAHTSRAEQGSPE